MWAEARANEKKIKELMVDHKKRAERRRAFYESRLGDPKQLLRVIGSSSKLYPDAEQYYYHENPANLMAWQGDEETKIDRFDVRALLDFIPNVNKATQVLPQEEKDLMDELNFERYHDLVEAERLDVSEYDRLQKVEEEWTKLLDRHKALLAMVNNDHNKSDKNQGFAYDYGTNNDESNEPNEETEEESQLLKEADILQYVDELTDNDKKVLDEMARKYNIRHYARFLRIAKKDRDNQLRELRVRQGKEKSSKESKRSKDSRKKRRRLKRRRTARSSDDVEEYESYTESSESEASNEEDEEEEQPTTTSDVIIEFGSSTLPPPLSMESKKNDHASRAKTQRENSRESKPIPTKPVTQKKLTPMEKLKLRMRQGLERQMTSDEKEKKREERERELDMIRGTMKEPAQERGAPEPSNLAASSSSPPPKKARYYSPSGSSSSSSGSRTPSPSLRARYRSPSPPSARRERTRSRSRSRSRLRSDRYRRRSRSRSRERASRSRREYSSRCRSRSRSRDRYRKRY